MTRKPLTRNGCSTVPSLFQDFINRSIGWDDTFSLFERVTNFPPHNISKTDEYTEIEIALAGYSKSDVDIVLHEGVLTISSDGVDKPEGVSYTHNGIARRAFTTRFAIGKYHEVEKATMENGMLVVRIIELIPDEKKPQRIILN